MTRQEHMPFAEALEAYRAQRMVPFHTPGHKAGKGAPSYMTRIMGEALPLDLGVMYALDDLFEPETYLKEAQELAAELYGAGHTFFSINGTTACIQAMILANVNEGETIILPREAHRSVMGGLILSGAVPVYMESVYSEREQVSFGPSKEAVYQAIDEHPEAKALFLINPSYYGIAGDIEPMIRYAHEKGLVVLVDEAHGAHLRFSKDLPKQALDCGADCVAQSTHKLTGSLTQTSMLHCHKEYRHTEQVAKAMALLQSTSPNYIFLASLDAARHQLYEKGQQLLEETLRLSRQLREQLNGLPGIFSFGKEILHDAAVGGFDETKITIDFSGLGLSGKEAERCLREQGIEVELVHGSHVLVLLTLGDTKDSAEALYQACKTISESFRGKKESPAELPLPVPRAAVSPRAAWYAAKEPVSLEVSLHRIAGETITYYPPGIPIISPGERITEAVIQYIKEKQRQGYIPNGAQDSTLQTIWVLQEK